MEYIEAKNMIYKLGYPWFGCDYNMNIYRGCCHGCIYCDSRSDCYHIEDFDKVKPKKDAIKILEQNLLSKKKTGVISTGSMSDPYNPFEKKLELTRESLKLMYRYGFGVSVITKSDLITRDIDIFTDIKKINPIILKTTITTTDDNISSKIEPRAPVSSRRFASVKKLSVAGLYAGILTMPIVPWVTDNEENIVDIVERAEEAGAKFIYASMGMTMRDTQRAYFYRELDKIYPGLKNKYIKKYGTKYNCYANSIKSLLYTFKNQCKKRGILYKMNDIVLDYKKKYTNKQLNLF